MPYSYSLSKNLLRISKFLKWLFKPTIKYSNVAIFIISIILSYFILTSEILRYAISKMGNFGYVGAFIGGAFYTTSFTMAPSVSLLYLLGKSLNPFLIALIGGMGAVITDFIIFHFVKKSVESIGFFSWLRVKVFLLTARSKFLRKIRKSKFAQYIIPVIAGLIIASPLPDELGIALMGVAKYETKKFLLFSFLLNATGILIVATAGKVI
jgi:hypothetical protein